MLLQKYCFYLIQHYIFLCFVLFYFIFLLNVIETIRETIIFKKDAISIAIIKQSVILILRAYIDIYILVLFLFYFIYFSCDLSFSSIWELSNNFVSIVFMSEHYRAWINASIPFLFFFSIWCVYTIYTTILFSFG